MAETPFAPPPAPPEITDDRRREIIIDAALNYMEHHDWYCAEEDEDPQVIADLQRLYDPDLPPTPSSGNLLFDAGVTLALRWYDEWREAYERSLPVWTCDCGAIYKREQWSVGHETVFTVTPDGLFDRFVGSTRGKRGIGTIAPDPTDPMNNGGCPSCRRAFKTTIARQTDPQTSFVLDLT